MSKPVAYAEPALSAAQAAKSAARAAEEDVCENKSETPLYGLILALGVRNMPSGHDQSMTFLFQSASCSILMSLLRTPRLQRQADAERHEHSAGQTITGLNDPGPFQKLSNRLGGSDQACKPGEA